MAVGGERGNEVFAVAFHDDGMARRGRAVGQITSSVQTDGGVKCGGIGVVGIDARGCDARGIGHEIGVIDGAGSGVVAQEGFAGDVADAGIDRNAQGALFAQALDGLQVGEAHEDAVAGLDVAELEAEKVVAFAFGQGGASAGGFEFFEVLAGRSAFFDFGEDDAAVDVHLATVSGGAGGQGEKEAAVEGLGVVLLEELVDGDVGKAGSEVGADADGTQGKDDAGVFEPGFETDGLGISGAVFHREVTFCFWRMRLMALTWAAVGRAPSRPIKAKEPSSGVTFQVSAENGGMVATGCCSLLARVRSSRRLASSRP